MTNLTVSLLTKATKPTAGHRIATVTFKGRKVDGKKTDPKSPNLAFAVPYNDYSPIPEGKLRSIYQTAFEAYQDDIISELTNAQIDNGIAPLSVAIDLSTIQLDALHQWLTDTTRSGGKRLTKDLIAEFFNEEVKAHIQLRIATEQKFNITALSKEEQELLDAAAEKWLDQFTKFAGPSYSPSLVIAQRLLTTWNAIDEVSKTENVWISIANKLNDVLNATSTAKILDSLI